MTAVPVRHFYYRRRLQDPAQTPAETVKDFFEVGENIEKAPVRRLEIGI